MVPYMEECVSFPSGPLILEGVLAYPAHGEPSARVLLLAPHPHMGGNMDNNLVRYIACRASEDGAATMRFNYRGVGRSQIRLAPDIPLFDHWSAMERDKRYDEILPDAINALQALIGFVPGAASIFVIGYSLGAILAGMLAGHLRQNQRLSEAVSRVAGISPPTKRVSLAGFAGVSVPKLFVAGDRDFAFDKARFQREAAGLPGETSFVELAGSDHFFRQEEDRVYAVIAPFLAACHGPDIRTGSR